MMCKSVETRRKMSLAHKALNFEPWNKGLKNCFSADTLRRMSESHKGKGKGRKLSELTKRRMSKSASRVWEERRPNK